MRRLVLLLALALPAAAQEESWGEIYMGKGKSGWAHDTSEKVEEGWVTRQELRTKMNRGGEVIDVETVSETLETADLKPARMKGHIKMGPTPMEYEGVIDGALLHFTLTTAGQARTFEIEWKAEAIGPHAAEELQKRQGYEKGTKYTYVMFAAELGKFGTMQVEVMGRETVDVLGTAQDASHLHLELLEYHSVEDRWVDGEGKVVKSYMPQMDMTTVRSTKEKALGRTDDAAQLTDLMQKMSPRANACVPHPRRVAEALFGVTLKDGDATTIEWPGANQSVEKKDGKTVWLRVKNGKPTTVVNRPVPSTPELEAYLKDNSFLQVNDPAIQAAAKEAVGAEENAWAAAVKLSRWVNGSITKKDMDVAFATASEVIKSHEGDCTEHAVLLAALARAAGIPSKVCCGFLYVGGHLGGHAWASVWVGEWVDIDATLAGDWADAMRVKMSESTLNEAGMAASMQGLYQALSGLSVDVVEVVRDGKAEKVASAPWFTVEGKTVRHSLGFTFDVPEGWTLVPMEEMPVASVAALKHGADMIRVIYYDAPPGRDLEAIPGAIQVVKLDEAAEVICGGSSEAAAKAIPSLHLHGGK